METKQSHCSPVSPFTHEGPPAHESPSAHEALLPMRTLLPVRTLLSVRTLLHVRTLLPVRTVRGCGGSCGDVGGGVQRIRALRRIDPVDYTRSRRLSHQSVQRLPASPGVSTTDTRVDLEDDSRWIPLASMSSPRAEFQAVALDGRIYAPGGIRGFGSGPAEAFDTLEAYDPVADSWSVLAPMPEARHHLITAGYHHHLYVFGGLHPISWSATDTAWRYNPESDRWSELAALPVKMGSGVAFAVDDTIYVIPGVGAAQTLWAYDPTEDTWQELESPLQRRDHLSGTTSGGLIYISGGRWSLSGELDTLEVFDPATGEWSFLAPMAEVRSGHAMASVGGALYSIGGELLSNSTTLRSVERYDIASDSWMPEPDLDGPIHGTSAVVIDGSIYLVGGAATVARANATGDLLLLTP